jgi:hypothetical protein
MTQGHGGAFIEGGGARNVKSRTPFANTAIHKGCHESHACVATHGLKRVRRKPAVGQ